jgi:hypothetical protein
MGTQQLQLSCLSYPRQSMRLFTTSQRVYSVRNTDSNHNNSTKTKNPIDFSTFREPLAVTYDPVSFILDRA